MIKCPHCENDDPSMIEDDLGTPIKFVKITGRKKLYCCSCSKEWEFMPDEDNRIN